MHNHHNHHNSHNSHLFASITESADFKQNQSAIPSPICPRSSLPEVPSLPDLAPAPSSPTSRRQPAQPASPTDSTTPAPLPAADFFPALLRLSLKSRRCETLGGRRLAGIEDDVSLPILASPLCPHVLLLRPGSLPLAGWWLRAVLAVPGHRWSPRSPTPAPSPPWRPRILGQYLLLLSVVFIPTAATRWLLHCSRHCSFFVLGVLRLRHGVLRFAKRRTPATSQSELIKGSSRSCRRLT
jgi:hypothetical protein